MFPKSGNTYHAKPFQAIVLIEMLHVILSVYALRVRERRERKAEHSYIFRQGTDCYVPEDNTHGQGQYGVMQRPPVNPFKYLVES